METGSAAATLLREKRRDKGGWVNGVGERLMTSPPVHNRTENHGAAPHIHDRIYKSSSQPRLVMAEYVTPSLLTHSAIVLSNCAQQRRLPAVPGGWQETLSTLASSYVRIPDLLSSQIKQRISAGRAVMKGGEAIRPANAAGAEGILPDLPLRYRHYAVTSVKISEV